MSGAASRDVLVTPIWRARLDDDEGWNLRTSIDVTPDTDHVLVAPGSLDTSAYSTDFPEARIERVPDRALSGIAAYSRLMLNPAFYRRFRQYEFVVICQTDAFLVQDPAPQLATFPYDYVGAPWAPGLTASPLSIVTPEVVWGLEQRIRPPVVLEVGNGGLSVRRVAAFERALRAHPLVSRFARVNEDLAVAWLGHLGALEVAPADVARRWFYETGSDADAAAALGFHALQRYRPDLYEAWRARGALPDGTRR